MASVTGLIGDGDETLRTSFGAASVAINLDEAVVEIDGGIVLNPGSAEGDPLGVFAGLVEADEMVDGLGLLRARRRRALSRSTRSLFFKNVA